MANDMNAFNGRKPVVCSMPLMLGEERTLVKTVLRERFDFLYLPECTPESAQRLHRLGLPTLPPSTHLLWHRSETHIPLQDGDDQWSLGNGVWIDALVNSIRSHLPTSTFVGPRNEEMVYLQHGTDSPHAHLRVQPETAYGEVTTVTLRPDQARAIAAKASQSLDAIWVPSTQDAVNACLAEVGFIPRKSRQDLVLAPLLSISEVSPFETVFKLTHEEVARYGQDSGDLNPLHLDDRFARLHGFKGRISHGMLFNSWVTRYLGTQYPGPGTIFLKQASSYFAPIYPGQEYAITVTVPLLDGRRGTMRVLVQLRDVDGEVALLSYNDVMHRHVKPDA